MVWIPEPLRFDHCIGMCVWEGNPSESSGASEEGDFVICNYSKISGWDHVVRERERERERVHQRCY